MGNGKNAWEPGETAREKAKAFFFLTIAAPGNICNLKKALENQHKQRKVIVSRDKEGHMFVWLFTVHIFKQIIFSPTKYYSMYIVLPTLATYCMYTALICSLKENILIGH